MSIYKLRLPFDFARRPECSRPTVALAILQCRASGDWLSLCAEPVSWRRSEPRAQLGGASPTSSYELGSECEITRIRICFLPVDLRGQPATSACSSSGWIDHVETRSPPYVRSLDCSRDQFAATPTLWPCASAKTPKVTPGTCWAGWTIVPPSSTARASVASTSVTPMKKSTESSPPWSGPIAVGIAPSTPVSTKL